MKLGKRLRILREVREGMERRIAGGMSKEEAAEEVQEAMKDVYGADADWLTILEWVLKILALFL